MATSQASRSRQLLQSGADQHVCRPDAGGVRSHQLERAVPFGTAVVCSRGVLGPGRAPLRSRGGELRCRHATRLSARPATVSSQDRGRSGRPSPAGQGRGYRFGAGRRPTRLPPPAEVPPERLRRWPPTAPIPLRRRRPSPKLGPRGAQRNQHRLSTVVEHRNPRDLDLGRSDADRLGQQIAPAPAPLDRLRARPRRRRPLPLAPARQAAVLCVQRADSGEGLVAGGGMHAGGHDA